MLLQILTSSSDINPISDFNYILNLAKCSKCSLFMALKSTNKLYASTPESSIIHEIDIPFLLNSDLEFRLNPDMIDRYESWFIPSKFPWIVLPSIYWDMYIGGDIYSYYTEETDYILYDKTTKHPLDQIVMHGIMYDYDRKVFHNLMDGFFCRIPTLSNPISFPDVHKNEEVRKVLNGKSSDGASLCILDDGTHKIGIYMYKGIISMNKDDILDIDIRFDKFENKKFMATYKPIKKKNPLKSNSYGVPFRERIHAMYVNIT